MSERGVFVEYDCHYGVEEEDKECWGCRGYGVGVICVQRDAEWNGCFRSRLRGHEKGVCTQMIASIV